MAKPDLSTLKMTFPIIPVISWQFINIIPNKLYTSNKEKLSDRFGENYQKVEK